MKTVLHSTLLSTIFTALCVNVVISFSPKQAHAIMQPYSLVAVSALCTRIRQFKTLRADTFQSLDILHKEAGVSKKQFIEEYFYYIGCDSQSAISYSADFQLDDVKWLAEYGIDLSKPFKDSERKTLTLKDYVYYNYKNNVDKKRYKWIKIYKYLKKRGFKSCAEQPELKCTATKYLPSK